MYKTIGTCSICGGSVQIPDIWHGVFPPTPTCARCGAHAAAPQMPVIPMVPNMPAYPTLPPNHPWHPVAPAQPILPPYLNPWYPNPQQPYTGTPLPQDMPQIIC